MTTQDELTKEEMRVRTKTQITEIMTRLTEAAIANVDKALASGACPPDWYEEGSHLLAKAIVDSLCVDRPLKTSNKRIQKAFNNLHLFL
jgi:hypothetical protein